MKINIDYPQYSSESIAAQKAQKFLESLKGMPYDEAVRSAEIARSILKLALDRHSRTCTVGEINSIPIED